MDEVNVIIAEADLNGDGKLDYAEFCHMLLNTSEECLQANRVKASQVMKQKQKRSHHEISFRRKSPSYKRSSYDRQERRREEIRMHLYSPDGKNLENEIGTSIEQADHPRSTLESDAKLNLPLSSRAAREDSSEAKLAEEDRASSLNNILLEPSESKKIAVAEGSRSIPTKLSPLQKVPSVPGNEANGDSGNNSTNDGMNSTNHPIEGESTNTSENLVVPVDSLKASEADALVPEKGQTEDGNSTDSIPHESGQTDHFQEDNRPSTHGEAADLQGDHHQPLHDETGSQKQEDGSPMSSNNGKGHEQVPLGNQSVPKAEGLEDGKNGSSGSAVQEGDSPDGGKGVGLNGGDGHLIKTVSATSVVTAPPKKPKDMGV